VIKNGTKSCVHLRQMTEDYVACVADALQEEFVKASESKAKISYHRDIIATQLRNYTCHDDTMTTSEPILSYNFSFGDRNFEINSLYDTQTAKIWKSDNFVSPEECAIFHQNGKPKLQRATIAHMDGGTSVSESRKAQQASYSHPDGNNQDSDPLSPLYQRVLALTNHHAKMNLHVDGQEAFTIIQYNKDDEYFPHCDGNCDGSWFIKGGRVATALLYCQVATRGGGTTFTKANVYVKPAAGTAVFSSYKGENGRMDEGFTEHSGCPVLEGEKWITTAWMRDGVSAQDPWSNFDPHGIRSVDKL